jgi:hypothetical protein
MNAGLQVDRRRGLPDADIGLGGMIEFGRGAPPSAVFRDHGASQPTKRDFIPLAHEFISSGTHKISLPLVIDPTNDPVSHRYDQAGILVSGL